MKWPSETLQNLANFWNTNIHIVLVLRKNVGRKYKQKKNYVIIRISKIWQKSECFISVGHFIKHKTVISEEYDGEGCHFNIYTT